MKKYPEIEVLCIFVLGVTFRCHAGPPSRSHDQALLQVARSLAPEYCDSRPKLTAEISTAKFSTEILNTFTILLDLHGSPWALRGTGPCDATTAWATADGDTGDLRGRPEEIHRAKGSFLQYLQVGTEVEQFLEVQLTEQILQGWTQVVRR